MSVSACESFFSNSSPNELSFRSDCTDSSTALDARIELLEAETKFLRSKVSAPAKPQLFRVEQIAADNSLVQFYTSFVCS